MQLASCVIAKVSSDRACRCRGWEEPQVTSGAGATSRCSAWRAHMRPAPVRRWHGRRAAAGLMRSPRYPRAAPLRRRACGDAVQKAAGTALNDQRGTRNHRLIGFDDRPTRRAARSSSRSHYGTHHDLSVRHRWPQRPTGQACIGGSAFGCHRVSACACGERQVPGRPRMRVRRAWRAHSTSGLSGVLKPWVISSPACQDGWVSRRLRQGHR